MGRYEGRTAVITGGVSGMGLATAQLLAGEGARVLVTGRSQAAVEAARSQLGEQVAVQRSDAASLADIDALASAVAERFAAVDLLFCNAGTSQAGPLGEVSEASWDEQFATNVRGPFFTVQRFAPLMAEGSAVVVTTSVADQAGMPGLGAYAASKAALRSVVRTLARELAPRVRVNAVSPGPIDTPIMGKMGLSPQAQEQFRESMTATNPLGRFGQPQEVARAVAHLAFEATYTTGHELPVDGGASQL